MWTIKTDVLRWLILYLITGAGITLVFNYFTYRHLRSSLKCPKPLENVDALATQNNKPAEQVAAGPVAQVKDIPVAQVKPIPPNQQPVQAQVQPSSDSPAGCITSLSGCLRLIYKIKGIQPPQLISHEKKTPTEPFHPTTKLPYKVPNIVHVIRFQQQLPFKFFNYVAFKSYDKYIKPHAIFFWGDNLPQESEWWERTVKEVPNIYYVNIKPRSTLGGEPIKFVAHASDYLDILNSKFDLPSIMEMRHFNNN